MRRDVAVADASLIDHILKRKRAARDVEYEVDLRRLLQEILLWANEFVPSASGSILLDDPVIKFSGEGPGRLHFMACFGPVSGNLAGTSLSVNTGIVGEVYRTAQPYFCDDVAKDPKWFSRVDEKTNYQCRSIICVPIRIDKSPVGVLELINREEKDCFDQRDFALLQIFAGYTATVIQNALDARKFEDMSKTDYLTGLFNYQALHKMLVRQIRLSRENGSDIGAVFFDMDYLKAVNDTHGHLTGSRLIVEVGEIARELFQEASSSLMARYGGDEFMILLPGSDLTRTTELAEAFRKRVAENVFLSKPGRTGEPALNLKGKVSCSVGVASLRANVADTDDPDQMAEMLTQAADSAMYRAKQLGKNRVVVSDLKGGSV